MDRGMVHCYFRLKKEIQECQQGTMSVTEYFTKLKGYWQQLSGLVTPVKCSCGKCECNLNAKLEESENEDKLMKFLMGLNDQFSAARRQFLLSTPLPSASHDHSLLLQDELSKKLSSTELKYDARTLASRRSYDRGNDKSDRPKRDCDHCKGNHQTGKCRLPKLALQEQNQTTGAK